MKVEINKNLQFAKSLLKKEQIERPMHEVRLILSKYINNSLLQIGNREPVYLEEKFKNKFFKNIYQRTKGKPISRILGKKEFFSRSYYIDINTLDPRPETEILVESVIKKINGLKKKNIKILDLGTGSGCIIISIFLELKKISKKLIGSGVDISEKALSIARKNAKVYGLSTKINFFKSDLFSEVTETYDIIVSNPPYIRQDGIEALSNSVKLFDPYLSLNGGKDGLKFYKKIFYKLPHYLKSDGYLFLEIGEGQFEDVVKIFSENKSLKYHFLKDYSKIVRCLIFYYKKKI